MRAALGTLAVAVLLSAAPAAADVPPPDPPPSIEPAAAPTAPNAPPVTVSSLTGVRRPVFLGLVAALFLMMGALVGANDKHHGNKPASRR